MGIFDIVGPVMVGPSSSHTAGAVKIGKVSRKLLGEPLKKAEILLYGSFLATGKGHGTDKAIVAGLLGMEPDDIHIPESFKLAQKQGIKISFGEAHLKNAHPNSVEVRMESISGRELSVVAASLGGGSIKICTMDGLEANFSGDHPTLVVHNDDQPGHVAEVTSMLWQKSINIATMQLYRDYVGGNAVMILECDQEIPMESVKWLETLSGLQKVTYLSKVGGEEE
ncbi:MAG: L-serine ammonia-lyase, iron-sulfur-dependent subunit beta [Anaerostipes sp.]|nr:L-serine ammonia-lyase, iron-sulfur-dependent subunit beta [Anaerostipes sp.]